MSLSRNTYRKHPLSHTAARVYIIYSQTVTHTTHFTLALHVLPLHSPHLTTWYETVKQFIHSFTNPSTHHHSRQHWSAGKKQHWLFHLAPTQWNWNLYVIILRKLFTFHSNSGGGSSSMCLGRWMDGGERFCLHRKAKRNKKKKTIEPMATTTSERQTENKKMQRQLQICFSFGVVFSSVRLFVSYLCEACMQLNCFYTTQTQFISLNKKRYKTIFVKYLQSISKYRPNGLSAVVDFMHFTDIRTHILWYYLLPSFVHFVVISKQYTEICINGIFVFI